MKTLIKNDTFARGVLAFVLGTSIILSVTAPAMARTRFDGLWSVLIITEQGSCERGYRYPLAIVNGVVQHASNQGDPSFVIGGRVGAGGAVRVTVRRGDQFAEGSGRLSSSTGEGRWRSPTGGCTGYWTAERRG
jgi:hypothetical protein